MIDKNLQVVISQQVQVYFISVITDRHDELSLFIQKADFLLQRELLEIIPHNHKINISKNQGCYNLDLLEFFVKKTNCSAPRQFCRSFVIPCWGRIIVECVLSPFINKELVVNTG